MRIRNAIVAAFVTTLGVVQQTTATELLFPNESKIEFKANSGDVTSAIEGYIMVPENRNNPDSRSIPVTYVRFPATGSRKGPPIVYLSGGPGGSGIGTAKWRRFPLFMALREYGDVIALDQRGTGKSEKTERCISDVTIPLDKPVAAELIKRDYRRAATQCLARWQQQGIDVYGYTSVQNALDINDLRKHLSADKVSLWGISYGSHLALAAMNLFPEQIDKVIIASAEGLDQTVKLPALTDAYFNKVQAVIDQQPLKEVVPDLGALMRKVHKLLGEKPIPLTIHDRQGGKTELLLQPHHMQMMAGMMIADPGQYLAMLIHVYLELASGKTELVSNILSRGFFKDEPLNFRLMPLGMDVASGITEKRLATVMQQAESSLLGDFLNFPMPLLNNVDSRLDLGDEFRTDPSNAIPTLLFSGSLDGRTYPEEQKQAVKGLSRLTQIEVKYAGHNLYTASPEVLTRMKAFLAGEKVADTAIELPLPDLQMRR